MAIARYKDLCIDSSNDETLGRFWAAALGLDFEPDGGAGSLTGPEPGHRVWMNVVPEAKTVKQRVHLDILCESVDDLVALGARVLDPPGDDRDWTVMADPEGGEFCAYLREPGDLPAYRLLEVIIDSSHPNRLAQWWADVFDIKQGGREDKDWWWFDHLPGMPYEGWSFVPVPEAKKVKNRTHWDVLVDSVDDLVAAGATVLRGPVPDGDWSIMADPEGNEFCAFVAKE
jgi:hypothetical protein